MNWKQHSHARDPANGRIVGKATALILGYRGRSYFFASEGSRAAFAKTPDRYVPPRDPEGGRMKAHTILARALVLAVVLVGAASAPAQEEHHTASPTPRDDVLSMLRFYAGAPAQVRVGDFPGRLVCLRCDLKPSPDAKAQCEKEGHRHALSMETDSMIHPLLASSEAVLKQINSDALHGKQVTVHGKYLPATGAIFVDRISPASQTP